MKKFYVMSDRQNPKSVEAFQALNQRYRTQIVSRSDKADVIIVLGGDGFMLKSLHRLMGKNTPVLGLNLGHVGALLNRFDIENLNNRIDNTNEVILYPLQGNCWLGNDHTPTVIHAFNEIAVKSQKPQALHLQTTTYTHFSAPTVHEVRGDGIMVATPIGSKAYFSNAGGRTFSTASGQLGIQSICCSKDWRYNQLVPDTMHICIDVMNASKRPAFVQADNKMLKNVTNCQIHLAKQYPTTLLFDPGRVRS